MVRFLIVVIFSFSLFSCVQESENGLNGYSDLDGSNIDTINADYQVISVPSPTQIASVVKILDLDYESELVEKSLKAKSSQKENLQSTLLGLYIVDMGYAAIYEKTKETEDLLTEISKLFFNLNIDSPNAYRNFERIKKNLNNKDSLFVVMLEIQNDMQNYFVNTNQSNVSISVLSGVFLEGLYISTKVYVEQLYNKPLFKYYTKKQIGMMMIQQEILLNNLISLHEAFKTEYSNVEDLKMLKSHFDSMKLSYSYNENRKRIDDVYCDYNLIVDLYKRLDLIRNSILEI